MKNKKNTHYKVRERHQPYGTSNEFVMKHAMKDISESAKNDNDDIVHKNYMRSEALVMDLCETDEIIIGLELPK